MTLEQQQAAQARCDAATPGPWDWPCGGSLWSAHTHDRVCEFLAVKEADGVFIRNARADLPLALAEIRRLRAEVERLKRGDWTSDEIHGICHNLHGKVNAREFADGCADEQRRLYGCAPDADELVRIKECFGRGKKGATP